MKCPKCGHVIHKPKTFLLIFFTAFTLGLVYILYCWWATTSEHHTVSAWAFQLALTGWCIYITLTDWRIWLSDREEWRKFK